MLPSGVLNRVLRMGADSACEEKESNQDDDVCDDLEDEIGPGPTRKTEVARKHAGERKSEGGGPSVLVGPSISRSKVKNIRESQYRP